MSSAPDDVDLPSRLLEKHGRTFQDLTVDVTSIVLVLRGDELAEARAFADAFAGAHVQVLGAGAALSEEDEEQWPEEVTFVRAPSERARIDYLMTVPRPQILVEMGNRKRSHKISCLRTLFHFVDTAGVYVVEELDLCGDPRHDDRKGQNVAELLSEVVYRSVIFKRGADLPRVWVGELGAGIRAASFDANAAVLHKREPFQHFKLRDTEADAVLTARYGRSWGETLVVSEASTFTSRSEVTSHGEGPVVSGRRDYDLPPHFLRRYDEVTCTARQILRFGDYVLPDSWRHPHQRVLNNRQLIHSNPHFGRYLDRTQPTTHRREVGAFYYLDTELPGHFGHITTDVLSRVWGWRAALAEDPTLRPLVSVTKEPKSIPGFQRTIFEALGIPCDDALIIGPREEVVVEHLYGVTPQLENPHYVHPGLADVWKELGANLHGRPPLNADRIFVSRRPSDKRHCRETAQIERFFAREGFAVVFPEDYAYVDQKELFAGARVIAGFGGSGMFNMMFAPEAKVVLISGSSYTAENEALIAAANGNELHYFWGPSEIAMPEGKFSLAAFTSGFSFDLRRFKRELKKAIA